jgi:hypothetical protein
MSSLEITVESEFERFACETQEVVMTEHTTAVPTTRTVRILDTIAVVALACAVASFALAFAINDLIGLLAATPIALIVFLVCQARARPNHVSTRKRQIGPAVTVHDDGTYFHRFGGGSIRALRSDVITAKYRP